MGDLKAVRELKGWVIWKIQGLKTIYKAENTVYDFQILIINFKNEILEQPLLC